MKALLHKICLKHLLNLLLSISYHSNVLLDLVPMAVIQCLVLITLYRKKCKINFLGVYVMKCICHNLHLACSEECKKLSSRCEDLVSQIYNFFSHSSKRQSQFYQFQKFLELQDDKILHRSATRWLSLSSVVIRVVEQWDAFKLFFNEK